MRSAELTRDIASEDGRRVRMEVIANIVRSYCDAQLSTEQLGVTTQAMRSAEADLARAQAHRAAGMATDIDTLSIRVHLAGVREQQIQRSADADVARAALNDLLGLPLDSPHELTTPLVPAALSRDSLEQYEESGVAERPEARQTKLAMDLAENQAAEARSRFLPEIGVHGAFEADRQRFIDRGGANWLASVELRWNLFNGFADKVRVNESRFALRRAEADAERVGSAIRLQVRRASADLRAAQQRIEVAEASVAEAEESLRIVQNRYDAGISTVNDLLRAESALLESRTRRLTAVHDQRIAATLLEMASGSLSADSEVLN